MHGRRIHRGRDVHEPQVADAARQLQVAHVADERDVGVVDGDRELGLIVERRGQVLALAGGRFIDRGRTGLDHRLCI